MGLSPTSIKATSGEIPQISHSESLIQKGLGPSTQRSANQIDGRSRVMLEYPLDHRGKFSPREEDLWRIKAMFIQKLQNNVHNWNADSFIIVNVCCNCMLAGYFWKPVTKEQLWKTSFQQEKYSQGHLRGSHANTIFIRHQQITVLIFLMFIVCFLYLAYVLRQMFSKKQYVNLEIKFYSTITWTFYTIYFNRWVN